MDIKEIIYNLEKIIRAEDFGINLYSSIARKVGKKEDLGIKAEKIAKEKVECKNLLQNFVNQVKSNKINLHLDNEINVKLNADKVFANYDSVEDDGKFYTTLVKTYHYQKELLNFYKNFMEISGGVKVIQFLINKTESHFDIISNHVDVQYDKYETFSSFWN